MSSLSYRATTRQAGAGRCTAAGPRQQLHLPPTTSCRPTTLQDCYLAPRFSQARCRGRHDYATTRSTSSSLQPTSSRTSEGRNIWQQAVQWFQGIFASIMAVLRAVAAKLSGNKQAAQSSGVESSDADFQRELAGTRVETALRKAVSFKKMNDPPKVMNELSKAIAENTICHSGSHTVRYSKEELQDLYQFYVQNAEMPAKRTELKQLRELLNLTERDTASIEASVLGSGDGWTI